jgi:hypothetical protein
MPVTAQYPLAFVTILYQGVTGCLTRVRRGDRPVWLDASIPTEGYPPYAPTADHRHSSCPLSAVTRRSPQSVRN